MRNLEMLILAGEHHRQVLAAALGLGTTESQALSYLEVHGSSCQSELARDLGLTSSALTALVDRLERQGVAERVQHPQDRRRNLVQVTARGRAFTSKGLQWLCVALDRINPASLEVVSASFAIIAEDLFERSRAMNSMPSTTFQLDRPDGIAGHVGPRDSPEPVDLSRIEDGVFDQRAS